MTEGLNKLIMPICNTGSLRHKAMRHGIGVVIVSFKSNDILIEVLRGVLESKNVDIKAIVISDYGTKKGILDKCSDIGKGLVHILRLKQERGPSYQRDLGSLFIIENFGLVPIAFIDNDVLIKRDTLYNMLNVLTACGNIGAVEAKLYNTNGSVQRVAAFMDYSCYVTPVTRNNCEIRYTPYVVGGACVVKPEVLRLIGYWSSNFAFWYEDVDFGLKIWRLGYKCVSTSKAEAIHYYGLSRAEFDPLTKLRREVEDFTYARVRCIYKHFRPLEIILGLLIILCVDIPHHAFRMLVKDRTHRALHLLFEIKGFVRGFFSLYGLVRAHALRSSRQYVLDKLLKIGLKAHILAKFKQL